MKRLRTILVAFAAVSLVGLTGCPEDDPSDNGNGNGNGDKMDVMTDTEPDPDMGQPDMQADMGQDTMEDTEQDMNGGGEGDIIPDIHDGTISTESDVDINNVLVTAKVGPEDDSRADQDPRDFGFFVQHQTEDCTPGDGGCGIFVQTSAGFSNYPARGDLISLEATVREQFGMLELHSPTNVTTNSTGNSLPDPLVVSPTEVWTNDGNYRAELIGTLLRVENVTTSNTNPDGPGNDFGEWAVWEQGGTPPTVDGTTTGLRVDDFFFPATESGDPGPSSEIDYDSITGPYMYSFGNAKLVPRDSADIVAASQ